MKSIVILTLAILSLFASLVSADVNFGSTARSAALSGAGLALGNEDGATAVINPAAPAVSGVKFKFILPGFTFHTEGASVGKLPDNISRLTDGNSASALQLANDFAKQNTRLSVTTTTGFTGEFGVSLEAEASGTVAPSAELQKWSNAAQSITSNVVNFSPQYFAPILSNTNLTTAAAKWYLPGLARDNAGAETAFDSYMDDLGGTKVSVGIVYALPAVTYSKAHQILGGTMWIGSNVKLLHSESSHYLVNPKVNRYNYDSGSGELKGVDMGFDAIELDNKSSISLKADIGAIYRPEGSPIQYGIVLNNFIKPHLKGFTDGQENTMISLGVAATSRAGFTFAADLLNVTRTNGRASDLRMGMEYIIKNNLCLRAGMSPSGFTWGVDLFGMNMAFGGNTPALISRLINL